MGGGLRSGHRIRLGPGGEFDLIRRFVAGPDAPSPAVLVGPGDDAAVLEGGWVVSTDLTVEDIHFRRGWIDDREVGYRAAAAALSDLAAMGAEPLAVLLSLAMPDAHRFDIEAVHAGAREASASVGVPIIGGDLSRSPGPLVVDVVVLGRADPPVLRSGARAGDELWVTGSLGAAAAAVALWENGREPGPELRDAYARPRPRVAEARFLVEHGAVHALIDLSDGLAGDAGHLAAAGGVRVVLEGPSLPLAPAAVQALGAAEARMGAMHGGEDYELLFAAAPGSVDVEAFSARFPLSLTRVGRIDGGEGVWLVEGGGEQRVERGGYSHVGEGEA